MGFESLISSHGSWEFFHCFTAAAELGALTFLGRARSKRPRVVEVLYRRSGVVESRWKTHVVFENSLTHPWRIVRSCSLRVGGLLFVVTAAAELKAWVFCESAKIDEVASC